MAPELYINERKSLEMVRDRLDELLADLLPPRNCLDVLLNIVHAPHMTEGERATLLRIRLDVAAAWQYVAAVKLRVKGRLEL